MQTGQCNKVDALCIMKYNSGHDDTTDDAAHIRMCTYVELQFKYLIVT